MCGGGGRGRGGAGWQRVGPRRQRSNAGTDRFRLVAYVLQGFVAVSNLRKTTRSDCNNLRWLQQASVDTTGLLPKLNISISNQAPPQSLTYATGTRVTSLPPLCVHVSASFTDWMTPPDGVSRCRLAPLCVTLCSPPARERGARDRGFKFEYANGVTLAISGFCIFSRFTLVAPLAVGSGIQFDPVLARAKSPSPLCVKPLPHTPRCCCAHRRVTVSLGCGGRGRGLVNLVAQLARPLVLTVLALKGQEERAPVLRSVRGRFDGPFVAAPGGGDALRSDRGYRGCLGRSRGRGAGQRR
eukprot:scaffold73357_cov64-Phaeocystis_antarctica.AAC.2